MNTRFSKIKSFLFFLDASSIKGFIITPEGVEACFLNGENYAVKGGNRQESYYGKESDIWKCI